MNPLASLRKKREVTDAGAEPAPMRGVPPASLQHYPRPPASHPRSWPWPAFLDSPSSPWLRSLRELYAEPIAFPDSISPEVGLLVHSLVRNIQPRTAVEVGCFVGISTHWIASALAELASDVTRAGSPPPMLHVFDLFGPIASAPWRETEMHIGRREWISSRLEAAGLTRFVTLHEGDSAAGVSAARAEFEAAGGVQFAFIDGDHTPPGVLRDFRAIEPVLATGGYLLLHDTIPAQCCHHGPRRLLDTLHEAGAGRYEVCEIWSAPLNYGLALLRRVG